MKAEELVDHVKAGRRYFLGEDLTELRGIAGAEITDCTFEDCDFTGSLLAHVDFSGSLFVGAHFEKVNTYGAQFRGAHFQRSTLRESAFWHSDFFNAEFSASRVSVGFSGSFFGLSQWSGCQLIGCRFNDAVVTLLRMDDCLLLGNDFSGAQVGGGSQIDDQTIVQSFRALEHTSLARHDRTNEADAVLSSAVIGLRRFLIATGIDPALVRNLADSVLIHVRPASVFISYSSADEELAQKLSAYLERSGVSTWFAPHDMTSTAPIDIALTRAIAGRDSMLLVLSPASIRSRWVALEVECALRAAESDGRRRIVVLALIPHADLEATTLVASNGIDLAPEVRSHLIRYVSDWEDPTELDLAVAGILRDLRSQA